MICIGCCAYNESGLSPISALEPHQFKSTPGGPINLGIVGIAVNGVRDRPCHQHDGLAIAWTPSKWHCGVPLRPGQRLDPLEVALWSATTAGPAPGPPRVALCLSLEMREAWGMKPTSGSAQRGKPPMRTTEVVVWEAPAKPVWSLGEWAL